MLFSGLRPFTRIPDFGTQVLDCFHARGAGIFEQNSPGILSRPGALPSFSFLTALSPSDLSGGVQVVVLPDCPV